MSRDDATILDILRSARLVGKFIGGMDKPAFLDDIKTQSSVLYRLGVIGEAVKRLSPEFRSRQPGVPWKEVAGMRDKVVHDYDEVDLDEVWKTATADIPRLIEFLDPLVPPNHP